MVANAAAAYSNSVTYTDTKIFTANAAIVANASAAYTNAVSYINSSIETANAAIAANASAAYSNAVSYTDSKIATANLAIANAYSNAVSYTDSSIGAANVTMAIFAGAAYSNAVSYTDSKIGTANLAIANAYSNSVSYTDSKIATANSAIVSNASAAYTNATSYTDSKIATANAAITANASAAYSNATSYSSNASNISSGTVAEARLPYRMNQNVRTSDSVEFVGMTLTGNLVVSGNVNIIGANNLSVSDNMIYLNSNNDVTNPDIGVAGNYNSGGYAHTGIFRDASDGIWKVFDNYLPEPDANVYIDTSNTTFHLANFQANNYFAGNTTSNWFVANNSGAYAARFYDINNLSYYVDPASTSVLSGLSVSSTISGSINGSAVSSTTAAKSSADTSIATTAFAKSLFYTASTSGTTDWNHASNLNPGVGTTLLLGTATNGPGGSNYYHPLNISYSDLGTGGEITQLAVCYATPANELYMRGRYSSTWSSWVRFLNSSNYSSYALPLTGGSLTGDLNINANNLSFGSSTRQMVNLWSTSYGIGVQSSTTYFRTGGRFSWFRGGVHSGTENDPGTGGTWAMTLDSSSNLTVVGSMRSPIFYDSADTTYYIDGASTSILTRLKVATSGTTWIGGFRGDAGITSSTVGTVSSFHSWYSARTPSGGFAFGTLSDTFYLKWAVNADIDAGTNTTTNPFLVTSAGNVFAGADSRAPIFYDSDNTGYYANPNGTSNFNGASFASQVNISTGTSQPLVLTTSSSGPWALSLVRSDTPSTISVYNAGGYWYFSSYVQSASSVRGTIFYDSDNTGYYFGGSSGVLYSSEAYADSWFRAVGSCGLYFQDYGYGIRSAHGEGNSYATVATYGTGRNGWSGYGFGSRACIMTDLPHGGGTFGLHDNNYGWVWRWIPDSYFSVDRGYSVFNASARAPIFYDSNDTGYYSDQASTSSYNHIRASRIKLDRNYGHSIFGVYASTRYQGVWSMGEAYLLPDDGTTTGNLYGMAWSHPNAGGAAGNLDSHGLLILINGGYASSMSYSIKASSNVTAYSDERLKTNWKNLPENFVEELAKVKNGVYDRIDRGITQVGVSAQSLQKLMPEAIEKADDEMGTLSVAYGNAALASAVELAKELVIIRKLVKEQQTKIDRLEQLIKELMNEKL
jgi:hypothetical protein